MAKKNVVQIVAAGDIPLEESSLQDLVNQFVSDFSPMEQVLHVLVDRRTGAVYCECHVLASSLAALSTTDVPLDPDEQAEYRANRELAEDHVAFGKMKSDAINRRSFSNLVVEYTKEFDSEHPLKIIGGQHRYEALKQALSHEVDEYHGIKVYFGLDNEQRLDVQLISNTNIEVSPDLLDRMAETITGPQLRNWCQEVGLLDEGQDFADRRQRGQPITVRAARTFIANYLLGRSVQVDKFEKVKTTPILIKTGVADPVWEELKAKNPDVWKDKHLREAGQEFAKLVEAQRDCFDKKKSRTKVNVDYAEKALNYAVLSAWGYVAGVLHGNSTRLKRHYSLRTRAGGDPLNAAALAKGRYRTDPDNYRGLGYRTDAKERGRLVELFYLQAEKGEGIRAPLIDAAIKQYHAKEALIEAAEAKAKV